MAVRKHLTQHQRTKDKIRTSQLITRLQSNALGKLKHPMTYEQIRCAEICISKTLPSLAAHKVEVDGDVTITVLQVAEHKAAK